MGDLSERGVCRVRGNGVTEGLRIEVTWKRYKWRLLVQDMKEAKGIGMKSVAKSHQMKVTVAVLKDGETKSRLWPWARERKEE